MDPEVFSAILALDSYNRGYNAGIKLPDTNDQIGNAYVLDDSIERLGAATEAAGFYATSYDWNNDIVVSYRGTDQLSDIWTGWLAGAGFNQASQAQLAIDYYKSITGATSLDDPLATHADERSSVISQDPEGDFVRD